MELSKIRTMYQALISEFQEAITELTYRCSVPSIDLGSIMDSMAWAQAFRRQHHSFIEHVENRAQTGVGYWYLLEQAHIGT